MSATHFPRLRRCGTTMALLALALSSCIKIPSLDEALAGADLIAQTTKLFAADGTLITDLHAEENRVVIPLEEVPPHVRDAVLAVEDARFYDHSGIDYLAVARAFSRNASEGRVVEGGSTITQQLVKNTLASKEKTFKRKIREAILAYQFEARFSKEEIFERYLNTVYFGRGAYGIEAAARTFFRRGAKDLTLVQGALLAGFIRSPSSYDPQRDPDVARARRNLVLRRMREERMITQEQYEKSRAAPLKMKLREEAEYPYAYFVDYVKDLIFDGGEPFKALGATRTERVNALFKGGLRIHTTLDPDLQDVAERSARKTLPYKSDPRTAFVAVRPTDGAVVAMVGGRDFFDPKDRYAKYNLAVRSRRQPGSAFKPFTLIGALEKGIPLTRVYRGGSQVSIRMSNGSYWRPRNYEGNAFGSMNLKRATALSVNVIFAQLVMDVGADKVVEVAKRMGIDSPLTAVPSITLGTSEVSPLDLAGAYATIASGGYLVQPNPITKITDASGAVLYEAKPKKERVLAEPVVALATEALEEVMKTGTGRRLGFGRPAAGKTGTSEEYADAWFAGFTPQMVALSWVGFPRAQIPMQPPRTRRRVYGSSWPGEMWNRFMVAAHKGLPEEEFAEADSLLIKVKVDSSRGCLPNEFTPPYLIKEQTFLRGSEPKDACTEPTSGDIPSTPAVVGKTVSAARELLQKAGFAVGTASRYCPAFPQGVVCDQTPAPTTSATVGERATIFVSSDSAVSEVPVVLGRTLERAKQKLSDAGYKVKVIELENQDGISGCRQSSETEDGRVWAQSPCGGATYGRGSTVKIYVNP